MAAQNFYGNPIFVKPYVRQQVKSGITALAGGGQTGATQLVAAYSRVDTVATAGDSVLLPQGATFSKGSGNYVLGASMTVMNNGAASLNVFPSTGDTINGLAANTAYAVPVGYTAQFVHIVTGKWYVIAVSAAAGSSSGTASVVYSATDNITAKAGGGQAGATVLTTQVNRVTTVATRGDSVALPTAAAGSFVMVINAGANPMTVFPVNGGSDTINGTAANTGVLVIPNEVAIFTAAGALNWYGEVGMGVEPTLGQIATDSYQDTITAFAGGGQGSATAIVAELNRVTTVATAGDSVKLPKSAAGLGIILVNHGAQDMAVFPATGDAIDDAPANASVTQMVNSVVFYFCATAGNWYSEGLATGFDPIVGLPTVSSLNSITAFAGGGQGSATALVNVLNRVTTVATTGDSVKLPASVKGLQITVVNAAAANTTNVFPATGDAINGLGANTAYPLRAGQVVTFYSVNAGQWHTIVNAGAGSVQQTQPTNPAATSSATYVMMGLAGALTPVISGRVDFALSGDVTATNGQTATWQLSYGTGSAPVNGAAVTGTQAGSQPTFTALTGLLTVPFSSQVIITGLTINTAYWFDLALKSSSGAVSVTNLSMSLLEV